MFGPSAHRLQYKKVRRVIFSRAEILRARARVTEFGALIKSLNKNMSKVSKCADKRRLYLEALQRYEKLLLSKTKKIK
jgi:hypothetical protein